MKEVVLIVIAAVISSTSGQWTTTPANPSTIWTPYYTSTTKRYDDFGGEQRRLVRQMQNSISNPYDLQTQGRNYQNQQPLSSPYDLFNSKNRQNGQMSLSISQALSQNSYGRYGSSNYDLNRNGNNYYQSPYNRGNQNGGSQIQSPSMYLSNNQQQRQGQMAENAPYDYSRQSQQRNGFYGGNNQSPYDLFNSRTGQNRYPEIGQSGQNGYPNGQSQGSQNGAYPSMSLSQALASSNNPQSRNTRYSLTSANSQNLPLVSKRDEPRNGFNNNNGNNYQYGQQPYGQGYRIPTNANTGERYRIKPQPYEPEFYANNNYGNFNAFQRGQQQRVEDQRQQLQQQYMKQAQGQAGISSYGAQTNPASRNEYLRQVAQTVGKK